MNSKYVILTLALLASQATMFGAQAAQPSAVTTRKIIAWRQHQEAKKCYANKDYANARTYLQQAIDQNDALIIKDLAQKLLTQMDQEFAAKSVEARLEFGKKHYTSKDYQKALECFYQVADQDANLDAKTEAHLLIGKMHFYGRDVEKDYALALNSFKAATRQKHCPEVTAIAHAALGKIYYEGGHGTEKDNRQARFYFILTSRQDLLLEAKATAQYCLGCIYYFGKDCAKNEEKAIGYLEQAASQNENPEAKTKAQNLLDTIQELLASKQ